VRNASTQRLWLRARAQAKRKAPEGATVYLLGAYVPWGSNAIEAAVYSTLESAEEAKRALLSERPDVLPANISIEAVALDGKVHVPILPAVLADGAPQGDQAPAPKAPRRLLVSTGLIKELYARTEVSMDVTPWPAPFNELQALNAVFERDEAKVQKGPE